MFPFDPPENIRIPLVFWYFQGDQEGTFRIKGLNIANCETLVSNVRENVNHKVVKNDWFVMPKLEVLFYWCSSCVSQIKWFTRKVFWVWDPSGSSCWAAFHRKKLFGFNTKSAERSYILRPAAESCRFVLVCMTFPLILCWKQRVFFCEKMFSMMIQNCSTHNCVLEHPSCWSSVSVKLQAIFLLLLQSFLLRALWNSLEYRRNNIHWCI